MFELELRSEQTAHKFYKPTNTYKRIKVVIAGFVVYVAMSANADVTQFEHVDIDTKPHIEYVQRIVSQHGAYVLEDIRQNWQKDLEAISSLTDNWDEDGACRIGQKTIQNTDRLISGLDKKVSKDVRLFPTPMGAVMFRLETGKGRVKGEMGDLLMSYFIKRRDMKTEHHSFEEVNHENMDLLKANLSSLV